MTKIKVLVVDDSAIVRKLLSDAISAEADLEVVGSAPDPFIARDKILRLKPDVVTLDIEMPRMDGLTFLRQMMKHHPLPTVVISSLCQASAQQGLEALRLGAVEVIAKPGGPYSAGELRMDLPRKIRAAAAAKSALLSHADLSSAGAPSNRLAAGGPTNPGTVIAIGASTGGTEAIREVLTRLPADTPPLIITQHIPPVFSRTFASRLQEVCAFQVKEAVDGDPVRPGCALIAPGNFHMVLRRSPEGLRVCIRDGPAVCYSRPSVDVMFSSVADACGADAIGVLLTGMGTDGAQGLLKMKRSGARTIAQDEASSVVFGMPKEAIRLGGVDRVLPLDSIPEAILTGTRVSAIR